MMSELLTEEEAAKWLRISEETLRKWRRENKAPSHTFVGRRPLYPKAAITEYLNANLVPAAATA